jgi:hypothetical protein
MAVEGDQRKTYTPKVLPESLSKAFDQAIALCPP